MDTKPAEWQASEAQRRFAEIVGSAASGTSRLVRRRDGQEVVVVSKAYFDRTKPAATEPQQTLKDILLNLKFEHDDGSFEAALAEGRRITSAVLTPTFRFEETADGADVGHERTQRAARGKKAAG